jgi:hypothetical protein
LTIETSYGTAFRAKPLTLTHSASGTFVLSSFGSKKIREFFQRESWGGISDCPGNCFSFPVDCLFFEKNDDFQQAEK